MRWLGLLGIHKAAGIEATNRRTFEHAEKYGWGVWSTVFNFG
jgi:hypothetical protein